MLHCFPTDLDDRLTLERKHTNPLSVSLNAFESVKICFLYKLCCECKLKQTCVRRETFVILLICVLCV